MSRSKVHMSKELKKKCHIAIHSAMSAAAMAGAMPIPMSDAIPITAAQISMIVALGKVFDIRISEAAAKSLMGVGVTQQAGRTIFSNLLKMFPGPGTVAGGIIGASTAAVITEVLGWIVADDFYRMLQGEEPENLVETAGELRGAFDGFRFSKR